MRSFESGGGERLTGEVGGELAGVKVIGGNTGVAADTVTSVKSVEVIIGGTSDVTMTCDDTVDATLSGCDLDIITLRGTLEVVALLDGSWVLGSAGLEAMMLGSLVVDSSELMTFRSLLGEGEAICGRLERHVCDFLKVGLSEVIPSCELPSPACRCPMAGKDTSVTFWSGMVVMSDCDAVALDSVVPMLDCKSLAM